MSKKGEMTLPLDPGSNAVLVPAGASVTVSTARWELKNFRLPVEIYVHHIPRDTPPWDQHLAGTMVCTVTAYVYERDTGLNTSIIHSIRRPFSGETRPTRNEEYHLVRDTIMELMAHEIDETLCFCGKRVHDPHVVGPRNSLDAE